MRNDPSYEEYVHKMKLQEALRLILEETGPEIFEELCLNLTNGDQVLGRALIIGVPFCDGDHGYFIWRGDSTRFDPCPLCGRKAQGSPSAKRVAGADDHGKRDKSPQDKALMSLKGSTTVQ